MINLSELRQFLKNQAQHTWAADAPEITPQRPGFDELEYKEGDWYIRDSYCGYYQAPGMSVVYYKNEPAWTMAYGGKMYEEKYSLTKETFEFLKRALKRKDLKNAEDLPVRGPGDYIEGDWRYEFRWDGDLKNFYGREKIFYRGDEVFFQDIIGGLIIHKERK